MPSQMKKNLINTVYGGRLDFMNTLMVTATGTGLGSVNYKVGVMVLDSSASDWFLCTATTGTGSWVKINA